LKERGVHFNEKIASSAQLRNPSLLQNLMDFAGIDGKEGQYATTLEDGCGAVPSRGFPAWAFEAALNKAQADLGIARKKKRDGDGGVEFVAASDRSRTGTPQGIVPGKTKSRFDDRARSPKRRRP